MAGDRRFGRTLSRARWPEYPRLLDDALVNGYRLVCVEAFLDGATAGADRVLILRHDVDQDARSALRMLREECRRDLSSTWYFRWRTADPRVIARVQEAGGVVGLHYETLSRAILARGRPADDAALTRLADDCRSELARELASFHARFGPTRSAAAHGDTRVPGINNAELLRGRDLTAFGIEWDANDAMRGRGLAHWLTDRSRAQGSWADGADPHALLAAGTSPILCLTHPNNWGSGARLWADRLGQRLRGDGDEPPGPLPAG